MPNLELKGSFVQISEVKQHPSQKSVVGATVAMYFSSPIVTIDPTGSVFI